MKKTQTILFISLFFVFKSIGQSISYTVIQQPCNNDGIVAIEMIGMTPPYYIYSGYLYSGYNNNFTTSLNVDTIKNISLYLANSSWGSSPLFHTQPYLNIDVSSTSISGQSASVQIPLTNNITINATVTPAFCPNLTSVGSVTCTTSNAINAEWGLNDWNPTTFTPTIFGNPVNLPPYQNYAIKVTDLNTGCSAITASASLNSNVISGITVNYSATPANCNNGAIALNAPTGGIAPYSYLWSNGATSYSIGGLLPGYYNVAVSDAQGCTEFVNYINVQQTTALNVNTTITNATCLQPNGSAMAFTSGGTAPYTYLWSNGATTQQINNVPTGNYYLTVTDANQCQTSPLNITIGINTPITITYTATASSCTVANGSATLTPVNGTAPYQIQWQTFPAQTGGVVSGLSPGTYGFNVTDAVGCNRSGTVYIKPVSVINANVIANNPICPATQGSLLASVYGTHPPFTYIWNTAQTTQNITAAQGSYYCTIKDAAQCTVAKGCSIVQQSPVGVGLNSTPSSCIYNNDGSVTATAYGGTLPYTYIWQNGQTTPVLNNLITGYYTAIATDANGCKATGFSNVSYVPTNTSCYCTIAGVVYNDANGNCMQDVGEQGIANQKVHCSQYGYVFTDANGYYEFKVPTGNYTISQTIGTNYALSVCQNATVMAGVVASNGCINTINFANTIIPIHDLQIITTAANAPPVVGNNYTQKIIIQNNGTVAENNIQLGYQHDGQLTYTSNTPNYLVQQNTGLFPNWFSQNNIPTLNPNSSISIDVDYNVPTNIPIGTNLSFYDTTAHSTPITSNWLLDNSPWDNVNTYNPIVVAGYDPNYIEVSPKGLTSQGFITKNDSVLTYVVHFQNEGSYYAQNIVVTDTLDGNLNWNSLKPLYANHNFTAKLSDNGILTYTFKNINLPWKSKFDNTMSSGMFTYSIKTKNNLPLGTTFTNNANIYFDYNPPVITNNSVNTLTNTIIGIPELRYKSEVFTIYPNPTKDVINVELQANETSNELLQMQVKITNILGVVVLTESTKNKNITLTTINLKNGLYFISVLKNNEVLATKKFIKQ